MDNLFDLPLQAQEQILNGPALAPPEGTIPNLVDPPNQTDMAIAIAVVCLFLGTMVGVLRALSRLCAPRKLYLEDYLGFLAFAPYCGTAWSYFRFLNICGFFVHQWNIKPGDVFKAGYPLMILPITYSLVMLLAKMAILLEWTRIFVPYGTRNTFYWTSRVLIALNTGMYIAAIPATAFGCIPQEKFWYTWIDGKCINRKSVDVCTAVFNLVMDLFILVLPQRVIWGLRMTQSRKIGVSLVFSVGLLACVCAAGRVYSNIALDYLGDATYAVSKTYIWALAELTCVLIVFCMPAIPKVFSNDSKTPWVTRVMGSLRSWTRLLSLVAGRRKTSSKKQSAWQSRQDQDSDQGQQVSLDEVKLMNEQAQLGSVTISRADLDPYQTYEGSGDIFKTTETHLEEQSLPDLATDPGISQRYHQDHNAAVWEQGLPARH